MSVWTLSPNRILLDRLTQRERLAPPSERAIEGLIFRELQFDKGRDILRQGDGVTDVLLVVQGVLGRYKDSPNGGRAYLSFHFRGDLPDAQALFATHIDHSLCAISDAVVAAVSHKDLQGVFSSHLVIALAVWQETLVDAAITRQNLFNNSAQPTTSRVAHFLCEYFHRARSAGLGKGRSVEFPLNQQQLGDALGMSLVTCNRSLQSLRRRGAIQRNDGTLTVTDLSLLAKIGNFDRGYLELSLDRP